MINKYVQGDTPGLQQHLGMSPSAKEKHRKHKIALLRQGRHLKGTNVFLNEYLTKHNTDIAKNARYLKKQKNTEHHVQGFQPTQQGTRGS